MEADVASSHWTSQQRREEEDREREQKSVEEDRGECRRKWKWTTQLDLTPSNRPFLFAAKATPLTAPMEKRGWTEGTAEGETPSTPVAAPASVPSPDALTGGVVTGGVAVSLPSFASSAAEAVSCDFSSLATRKVERDGGGRTGERYPTRLCPMGSA